MITLMTVVPLVISLVETFEILTMGTMHYFDLTVNYYFFFASFLLETEQQQPMTVSQRRFT